ncbi:MAG TPA: hypothetical protein VKT78_16520 [Fimbriimonadaceae bacterium]|nr:hypothetical protein [Fimbriimonadaceae bacterium]
MRLRWTLIAILLVCAIPAARANGAMGLALEMFGYEYWWPYVAVMVVLEAWMIGRKLGDGWPKALGYSLIANCLTGFCCGSNCLLGVAMHSAIVGSSLNPDPFLNAIALFTGFGLVSAFLESVVWRIRRPNVTDWCVIRRSLIAHAVGVPVALTILLIPARPYKGLEITTNRARQTFLRLVLKEYVTTARNENALPRISNAEELATRFGSEIYGRPEPDAFAAAYRADFLRLDFGEAKRLPYEWNSRVNGLSIDGNHFWGSDPRWIWLMRSREGPACVGVELNLNGGELRSFGAFGYAFRFPGEQRLPELTKEELDKEAEETLKAYH